VVRSSICANCGAKFRTGMRKCPRCRAVVVVHDPKAAAAWSLRLQKVAAGLGAVFVLALGVLWLRQDRTPVSVTAPVAGTDPLSTRRPAGVPERAKSAEVAAPAVERPFMEAAGTGYSAYAAGDLKSALAAYQSAVEKNPNDAEAWSNLGQVLVKQNRVAEAIPDFDKATALIPGRWAYRFNRARALALLNRWDEAIADYRQAQQLFPNDYATAFNLAIALHKKGDEDGAVTAYQQAIALAPDDPSFRVALAVSLERLGKKTDAADAYKEYLRLSPSAPDADKIRVRISQLTTGTAPTGA